MCAAPQSAQATPLVRRGGGRRGGTRSKSGGKEKECSSARDERHAHQRSLVVGAVGVVHLEKRRDSQKGLHTRRESAWDEWDYFNVDMGVGGKNVIAAFKVASGVQTHAACRRRSTCWR
eukprot:6110471-Pleurochrysis_carterae.AAC.3